MTGSLESRLERLERQAGPRGIRFLWADSPDEAATLVDRHLAAHPQDRPKQFFVFRWQAPGEAAGEND
jgi:hypothetical protein